MKKDLQLKFSIICFLIYFGLILSVILVYKNNALEQQKTSYETFGNEILNFINYEISDEELSLEDKRLYSILDKINSHVEEIEKINVYKIQNNNLIVLYSTKHSNQNILNEYEIFLLNTIPDKKIETFFNDDLLICTQKIFNERNECEGFISAEINFAKIKEANNKLNIYVFIISFIIMFIIFRFAMRLVAARIITPLQEIYSCLQNFKYNTKEDMKENIVKLKELNIQTNKQIQSIYEGFIDALEKSYKFQTELASTNILLNNEHLKARTDILTNVNNKVAYEEKISSLQAKIQNDENIKFSIIMADINNLKYVNDNFGHDKGDDYIKGCISIIKDSINKKCIYRIGGDEFVIILEDEAYFTRYATITELTDNFNKLTNDNSLEPYNKFSMSLGYSDFHNGMNVIDVVKSADKEMYIAKQEFKGKYGSYR